MLHVGPTSVRLYVLDPKLQGRVDLKEGSLPRFEILRAMQLLVVCQYLLLASSFCDRIYYAQIDHCAILDKFLALFWLLDILSL